MIANLLPAIFIIILFVTDFSIIKKSIDQKENLNAG